MDEVCRKTLIGVRRLLQGWISTQTLTSHDAVEAQMAMSALDYELAKDDYDPQALAAIEAREAKLADALLRALGGSAEVGDRRWAESGVTAVGTKLARAIAGDADAPLGSLDAAGQADIARQVRDFLIAYRLPIDPVIAEGPRASYGEQIESAKDGPGEPRVTNAGLTAYLRKRFPDEYGGVEADVRQIRGGYSKATYRVTLSGTLGGMASERRIIIRQDRPGLPTGSSVVDEFPALREVHGLGLPVPEPLWLEPDPTIFGTAAMAVSFIEGTPGRLFPTDPEKRKQWAFSLCDVFIELHGRTRKPELDVRALFARDLDRWRNHMLRLEREPHPGAELALRWLRQHLDDLKGRPVCRTHGDLAFHNVLVHEDQVSAALDWEFTHYSDPLEDLVYVQPFIAELGLWNAFLERYIAGTGHSYDAAAAKFLRVFVLMRIIICNIGVLSTAMMQNVHDMPLFVAGGPLRHKFEIATLDALIED